MQSMKSLLTFKALNDLGSGCHGDMISAIWRTAFELRQGLESMAPERRQQGIINEMFSTVMPPCWPTDGSFFAATWKDCSSCRFCLDRVWPHFYFYISFNCDWSFSRMHYLYTGSPIQKGGRCECFQKLQMGIFKLLRELGSQLLLGTKVCSFFSEEVYKVLLKKILLWLQQLCGLKTLPFALSETLLVVWPSIWNAKCIVVAYWRNSQSASSATQL